MTDRESGSPHGDGVTRDAVRSASEPRVLCELHEDILVVTLNKPSRLNALSPAMLVELAEGVERAAAPDVRGMVLTGSGRGFCAGADLRPEPADMVESTRPRLRYDYNPLVTRMAGLAKPVVAAVNGPAAGAGLGLAFAADVRIGAPAAKFVPAFIKIGGVTDMGVSYHLPRLIGYSRSVTWMLSGEPMAADEALAVGLIDRIVASRDLVGAAISLCRTLTIGTVTAVALTKDLLRTSLAHPLPQQLELEARYQAQAAADPEREKVRQAVIDSLNAKSDHVGSKESS